MLVPLCNFWLVSLLQMSKGPNTSLYQQLWRQRAEDVSSCIQTLLSWFWQVCMRTKLSFQLVYNLIQLGNDIPFMGGNTVWFCCLSNCRCQIKIFGYIQKHFLSMETGVSSVENGLVTGGEIHGRESSLSLSWGVDLEMSQCCELY